MKSIFVDINEFTFDPIHSSYIESNFLQSNEQLISRHNTQFTQKLYKTITFNPISQNYEFVPMERDSLDSFSQDKNQNLVQEQEGKENLIEEEQSCKAQTLYLFEAKFLSELNV
eukprot:TRINITY_DN10757_c0_g1_i3.p1 TRINITY_DN10757_c0_g1~~TRINITY_DN10757_c0_g1_i3.p1  ORF type:complete len:114 (+),score=17.96 TRINITY_DN10757_c0_g1_i3:188-529(+)